MKKILAILIFVFILGSHSNLFAQEALKNKVEGFINEKKYDDCISCLADYRKENKKPSPEADYYTALCRYNQLKSLEETQSWNEYFDKGNTYRKEISESAQKAIEATNSSDPVNIYSRLIVWRMHKDQDDGSSDELLDDLITKTLSYSEEQNDINVIKDIADQVSSYGEKYKAKHLYKAYVRKLIALEQKADQLLVSADNFYKEGNLDLAEAIYDAYIQKISQSKETVIPKLKQIALQFSCASETARDPQYAEKIFQQLEGIAGKDYFDEDLLYLRAFNLQAMKEFSAAKDKYLEYITRFPQGGKIQEVTYKVGLVYAYVLRDKNSAAAYFEKLAQLDKPTAEVISSLYQLGLINQWSQDNEKATRYYQKLISLAKDNYNEKLQLAKQRLSEIESKKPLANNIKILLDASFKEETSVFDMSKVGLQAQSVAPKVGQEVSIEAAVTSGESGCMQPQLDYFWSGDLGNKSPDAATTSLTTSYSEKGVKIIGLVVSSGSGIIDRGIEILDIN